MSVRRLRVRLHPRGFLPRPGRRDIKIIENLDLDLQAGETLGIIGESGCGKTTLAHVLAGLQPATSGSIRVDEQELLNADDAVWRAQKRHIQLLGEDVLPKQRAKTLVGRVLGATLKNLRADLDLEQRTRLSESLLLRVGLLPSDAERSLQSLSPVEAHRVALAQVLAPQPRLLICDDPGAALEASEQTALIDLIARLCREDGTALLFMARQPLQARRVCDRVMAMYLGRMMEQGEREALFSHPAHPYTRALLATPLTAEVSRRGERRMRLLLDGERPSPAEPPMGCVYHPRCPMAEAACVRQVPHAHRTGTTPRHYAACLFAPQPPAMLSDGGRAA